MLNAPFGINGLKFISTLQTCPLWIRIQWVTFIKMYPAKLWNFAEIVLNIWVVNANISRVVSFLYARLPRIALYIRDYIVTLTIYSISELWGGLSGVDMILDIKILIPKQSCGCRVASTMYETSFIIYAELLLHGKVEMMYYKPNGLKHN